MATEEQPGPGSFNEFKETAERAGRPKDEVQLVKEYTAALVAHKADIAKKLGVSAGGG